jgi:predicted MFS family arabinose efflux permease
MAWRARVAEPPPAAAATQAQRFGWGAFGFGLAGYFMFGLGYIGYMTFIVTLLREQGLDRTTIAAFYALLGLGVIASPWLWAGLLQRAKGGGALATLSALLALATALPVLLPQAVPAFVSGALFGAVFLSLVASTTALVRHNLPAAQWARGIGAFTIVFAAGQIVGPSLVGRLADGAGGLRAGLAWSAGALALGALLAWRQRPLAQA